MIKEVLAISGKPGLYRLISRGTNMLIVESLDEQKKRMPAYASDRVVAVAEISIYTDDGEDTPLVRVFDSIKKEYEGKEVDINHKKADNDEVITFFAKVLPNYDTERVRVRHGTTSLCVQALLISSCPNRKKKKTRNNITPRALLSA